MKRPAWIYGFTGVGILLFLAAGLPAWRGSLWGGNAWTFLHASGTAVAIALSVLVFLLVVNAPAWPERPTARAGLAIAAGAVFYLLRDRTHLLGDGRLWLAVLRDRPIGHPHEPLAFLGARLAALTAGGKAGAVASRVEIWNVGLGVLMVALFAALAGRLGRDRAARWFALALFLSLGVLQFACGYVEAYGALCVAVLLFLITGFDAIERRAHPAPAAFAWGLAAGVHGSAFLLFPALVVVLLVSTGGARRWAAALAAALVPLATAYVLVPALLPGTPAAGAGTGAVVAGWAGLFRDMTLHQGGAAAWMLEQVNRGWLSAGAALLLIGAAIAGGVIPAGKPVPERAAASRLDRRTLLFFAVAAAGLYLPALVLDMGASRGSAADWDAFAAAAIPLGALAASLWALDASGRTVRAALASAVAVGLFGTVSFLLVNADPRASVARFESLAASSFRTARARSWGYETLALYRRDQGDLAGAADAYSRAVSLQPANVRLLRNAAGTLSRSGRARDAAAALRALTRLLPDDFNAWLHLGMEWDASGSPDSARTAFREAVRLNPRSVDAMNELARLLLGTRDAGARDDASRDDAARGERREAYDLIRRSLALDPGQQHAAELRDALSRLEREGAGVPETRSDGPQ